MKHPLLALPFLLVFWVLPQSVPGFTDDDYRNIVRDHPRVLFYSVSPDMPLSVEGLKEIRSAAEALDAKLVLVADPAASVSAILSLGDQGIRYQRSAQLRDQGIQLHYPSLIVSDNHKTLGTPIAGFKSRTTYIETISDLLKSRGGEDFRVADRLTVPRRMSPFFKPVYGTDLIASGNSSPHYLFNLKTRRVFDIPDRDWGDPGPTPDGKFLTLLGFTGLRWFSTEDILTGQSRVLLRDDGLKTYQSVGQLSAGRYRVLGALSSSTNPTGLIVRDYESGTGGGSSKIVTAITDWRPVCVDRRISIPMMSKTGQLLSGSYEGSLRVFRIGTRAADCEQVFDSKSVTGKADFSADDRYLVYVSRAEDSKTRAKVDTVFLADLRAGTSKPIYYSDDSQLAFPGFISPDRIVVFAQNSGELLVLTK